VRKTKEKTKTNNGKSLNWKKADYLRGGKQCLFLQDQIKSLEKSDAIT